MGLVHSVEISPFLQSDHQCVFLAINLPSGVERGPGLWKFNVSILQNVFFCAEVEEFWCNWRSECSRFYFLLNWYEADKIELPKLTRASRRRCASSSALVSKRNTERFSHLLREAQGAQLRAQVQEAEEGERSTSYFLRKEKVCGQQKLTKAVRQSDGSVVGVPGMF